MRPVVATIAAIGVLLGGAACSNDGEDATPTTAGLATQTSAVGDLEQASDAIRQACRRFYGVDYAVDDAPDHVLTEPELVDRCDTPPIEWRSDCYADRPPMFVPGVGGCAHLGGYLSVYAGAIPEATARNRFEVDGTLWSIFPESD